MTKYSKSIVRKVASLIKNDSYTIAELCKIVGISEDTYHTWKKTKSEFSESIKKAEDARMEYFASEAKKSLLKLIQGYTVQEKKTVTVNSGKLDESGKALPIIKEQVITDKHFQPSVPATIFALINADPTNWKNRQNTEVTGKDGKDIFYGITDEQLISRINELERKIKG